MTEEEPRVGVYVCNCGTNIAGVVDVDQVVEYAKTLPNVVHAKKFMYTCSSPAQDEIKDDIKKHNLNRVVVASCSPKMHEKTFRAAVKAGGLNPYLYEQANIREHCSWVHADEPEKATEKAKDLVRMAIAKARLLNPLDPKKIDVIKTVTVIGAGTAGIKSALDIAKQGFKVHLLEKTPFIGGKNALKNSLPFTEESPKETIGNLTNAIAEEKNITIHTNTEPEELGGYLGKFEITATKKPRHVKPCKNCGKCIEVCPEETDNEYDHGISKRKAIYIPYTTAYPSYPAIDMETCTKCGECIKACPENAIDLEEKPEEIEIKTGTIIVATGTDHYRPKEGEYGWGQSKKIITQPQLERLLDPEGPTEGKLEKTPKNIAFISCVGSRQTKTEEDEKVNEYCSRTCCTVSIKNAITIKDRYPDTSVFYLCRDIRTYGRNEYLYRDALEKNIIILQYEQETPPQVEVQNDKAVITINDILSRNTIQISAELVVLATGTEPRRDSEKIGGALKLNRSADGFFQEAHIKLRPLETSTEGIFLAGTCQSPKNMQESIASASAAAAKASTPLVTGEVELEPTKAMVTEFCDGCAICIDPCLGKAITLVEYEKDGEIKKKVEVNEALCKGCGVCMATCPKKGIMVRHFTLDQLQAMVDAAIETG
ncbi:MAG: CoB--CoM heterodisulfide reductase iron-sulfur subunit A family protein [Candidatus Hydrothermarchaeales archaeon]